MYDESEFGSNPIIAASARGHVPAVVFLLSSGGAANQADLEKRTALHHAGKLRSMLAALCFLFLWESRAANLRPYRCSYWKALRGGAGVTLPPPQPSAQRSPRLSQVLLSYEARVNSQDILGNTPLHYAAENGDEDTIDLLLSVGCETALENSKGKTPLQIFPDFPWQESIARGTSDPPPVTATNLAASQVSLCISCSPRLLAPCASPNTLFHRVFGPLLILALAGHTAFCARDLGLGAARSRRECPV